MKVEKMSVIHDFYDGVLNGKEVISAKKLYRDAQGFYINIDETLDKDTIMYEVYSYSKGEPKQVGNLNWGLTVLKPVLVDGECNMTRGHFHEDLDCAEIYIGLGGEGLLLLMDETGQCHAQKVEKGSIHHIDSQLAHRLINTGDCDMKVGACWNTTAGHDYERIEKNPFTVRVFKENEQIVFKDIK